MTPDSNPYRWCNNNLVVNTDPSGLWSSGPGTVLQNATEEDLTAQVADDLAANEQLAEGDEDASGFGNGAVLYFNYCDSGLTDGTDSDGVGGADGERTT